jgi:hypothetical protein
MRLGRRARTTARACVWGPHLAEALLQRQQRRHQRLEEAKERRVVGGDHAGRRASQALQQALHSEHDVRTRRGGGQVGPPCATGPGRSDEGRLPQRSAAFPGQPALVRLCRCRAPVLCGSSLIYLSSPEEEACAVAEPPTLAASPRKGKPQTLTNALRWNPRCSLLRQGRVNPKP